MTSPKEAQKEMVNELKRPQSAASRVVAGRRRAMRGNHKNKKGEPTSGGSADSSQHALVSQIEKEMKQDQKSAKEVWGRKAAAFRFNSELSRQAHPGKLDHYHAHVNPNAFHTPKQNGFRHGAEK